MTQATKTFHRYLNIKDSLLNKYTIGVAADNEGIVLVKKNKPAWQAGYYNFVGGKVEPGESYLSCMVREFEEETGVYIPKHRWNYVGYMTRPKDFIVKIYATDDARLHDVQTKTEEDIVVINPDKFLLDSSFQSQLISNLLTIYNFTISRDFQDQNAELRIIYK